MFYNAFGNTLFQKTLHSPSHPLKYVFVACSYIVAQGEKKKVSNVHENRTMQRILGKAGDGIHNEVTSTFPLVPCAKLCSIEKYRSYLLPLLDFQPALRKAKEGFCFLSLLCRPRWRDCVVTARLQLSKRPIRWFLFFPPSSFNSAADRFWLCPCHPQGPHYQRWSRRRQRGWMAAAPGSRLSAAPLSTTSLVFN